MKCAAGGGLHVEMAASSVSSYLDLLRICCTTRSTTNQSIRV